MHGNFRVRGLLNIEVTKVLLVFLGKSAVVTCEANGGNFSARFDSARLPQNRSA